MGDVADLEFVRGLGYRNYMLSDGLCFKEHAFRRAMAAWASWSRRP